MHMQKERVPVQGDDVGLCIDRDRLAGEECLRGKLDLTDREWVAGLA